MFSQLLVSVFLLKVATALPAGVYVGRDGSVGASWGGYSASAGLGGLVGGAGPRGGLHAQAGTPDGHFAAAGLGGSVDGAGPQGQLYSTAGKAKPVVIAQPVAPVEPIVYGGSNGQASSSASSSSNAQGGVPTTVNKRPGSFFDDIFNIPISTLGAVNQYLNNRNRVAAVPAGVVKVQHPQPVQSSPSNSFASASSSSSSAGASSSSSNSAAGTGSNVNGLENSVYYQKNPNYNDIFNIPISVLGAVNRFLNGK